MARAVQRRGVADDGRPRDRAVVGLVGQVHGGDRHRGDAVAVTLHRADLALPDAGLTVLAGWRVDDAGEIAHAAWGWALADDPEAAHWDLRARGVIRGDEHGFRFHGRRTALSRIASWLSDPPGRGRPLVVTGSPGSGKSAVLGRLVTTADERYRRRDLIDLDEPAYFDRADLVAYVLATLRLRGEERSANPYHDLGRAGPVAERITDLAQGNYPALSVTATGSGVTVAMTAGVLSIDLH